jgi:hypothetical protein
MMNSPYQQAALEQPPTDAPPATPAAPPITDGSNVIPFQERVPEKYRVVKDDGSIDVEASAAKLAEGYDSLSKRLGGDDAPPKSAEEYAPEVPEGFDFETLKADPMYQDFLKGAHARGVNNKQLSYILEEFGKRQSMAEPNIPGVIADMDTFKTEMGKVWGDDPNAFTKGINDGLKVIKAYMPNITEEQLATIPNSPIVAQLLAAIGKEIGEDKRITAQPVDAKSFNDELIALQVHPAFNDPRHPEHKQIMDKKSELFKRRYGGAKAP